MVIKFYLLESELNQNTAKLKFPLFVGDLITQLFGTELFNPSLNFLAYIQVCYQKIKKDLVDY